QRRLKPQRLTAEDTMIQHPTIAAALADQRRITLMAEADTARLVREARAARHGRDRSAKWPVRWLAPRPQPRPPATPTRGPPPPPPPPRRWARLRPARAG